MGRDDFCCEKIETKYTTILVRRSFSKRTFGSLFGVAGGQQNTEATQKSNLRVLKGATRFEPLSMRIYSGSLGVGDATNGRVSTQFL